MKQGKDAPYAKGICMSLFEKLLEQQKQVTHVRLSWAVEANDERAKTVLREIGFRQVKDGLFRFSWQERKEIAMFFVM